MRKGYCQEGFDLPFGPLISQPIPPFSRSRTFLSRACRCEKSEISGERGSGRPSLGPERPSQAGFGLCAFGRLSSQQTGAEVRDKGAGLGLTQPRTPSYMDSRGSSGRASAEEPRPMRRCGALGLRDSVDVRAAPPKTTEGSSPLIALVGPRLTRRRRHSVAPRSRVAFRRH